jgi:oxygen-dependent protoporphyrinogen oxidase
MRGGDGTGSSSHVVVVGGGITGLSAAFYLERAAQAAGLPLRYTLIEAAPRLGGKLQTERIELPEPGAGGFLVEAGPDSFVTSKPWGLELVRELGLESQLIGTNPARRRVYVLVRGRPCPMPEGMQLGVPTRWLPFLRSPVLSPLGKLRVALDLIIPPRRGDGDETLGSFIRRRLGAEALDRIAEPLLAGIYNAESDRQSLLATFPQFREMELKYGSLIRGMLAARARATGRSGGSAFVALRSGMGELVAALAARLNGRVLLGRRVEGITYRSGTVQPYQVHLDDGEALVADAVVLAASARAAASLVEHFEPGLAAALRQIRYVSTATVSLAYREPAPAAFRDGYGLIIPRSEGRRINALTLVSHKFEGRAPEGYLLVRAFVGGSRNPQALSLDDAVLVALVRQEVEALLGLCGEPLLARVYRWLESSPQYDAGHLDRVAELEARCPPGLFLAGSSYRGVGIPDCIRQGKECAQQVVRFLQGHRNTMASLSPETVRT